MPDRQQLLREFIATEQLPDHFEALAQTYYSPLIDWVAVQRRSSPHQPLTLGINGCQGSGKSTLAALIAFVLGAEYGWNIAVLSIDDLYLTRAERTLLATQTHPLLITRGVPGTHDIALGMRLLNTLIHQQDNDRCALPRFDKARDDRLPEAQWPVIEGAIDIVILEGWCVGSRPQPDEALRDPLNELEAREDADGRWRHFVNQSLYNYQPLFARLDKLLMLKAPDFSCVHQWRLLQERKLAARTSGAGLMGEQEIARFIQHYQRLTQANIELLPDSADVVFDLTPHHEISAATYSP
mgnify:CR=1 FL=1